MKKLKKNIFALKCSKIKKKIRKVLKILKNN
jgi:hypothetical protein